MTIPPADKMANSFQVRDLIIKYRMLREISSFSGDLISLGVQGDHGNGSVGEYCSAMD
jgi:hypothetical protein